ncbi:hypothetical protein [Martelella radicis]|uniref:Uncharacterized protein n=1 Tax=Martelella radicis TaxID=1397476 RepID=A0A7W6KG91_9HYPH|nr:hypothetical protein [Martelella radicis]MBB4120674.1 hypothetical protein [Martelella radicis]
MKKIFALMVSSLLLIGSPAIAQTSAQNLIALGSDGEYAVFAYIDGYGRVIVCRYVINAPLHTSSEYRSPDCHLAD